jgi:hypothetical protein
VHNNRVQKIDSITDSWDVKKKDFQTVEKV